MTELYEFVADHAARGACRCGVCIDRVDDPENKQPEGHTADLIFFKVGYNIHVDPPDKEEFVALVKEHFPHWLDGEEHSFIEIGADIGDQGAAMMTMGLGKLLGVWELLTPRSLGLPEDLAMTMAQQGLVTIKVMN